MSAAGGAGGGQRSGGTDHARNEVCRYYLEGRCLKGDKCPFIHERVQGKIPLCNSFRNTGVCTKVNCQFSHELPPACEYYQRGFCRHGDKCSGWHKRPAEFNEPCLAYLLGFCPRGPDCRKKQFVTIIFSSSFHHTYIMFSFLCVVCSCLTVPNGLFLKLIGPLSKRKRLNMASLLLLQEIQEEEQEAQEVQEETVALIVVDSFHSSSFVQAQFHKIDAIGRLFGMLVLSLKSHHAVISPSQDSLS